jgi:acyl-CoA dehydrogenase
MVRKAAALFDAGEPCGAEANMAKYLPAPRPPGQAGEAC